ncbi:MAG: Holliday junction branch migration protein RuvA [Bacteroidota bacterium]
MIARLTGTLGAKAPTEVIVDVQGVGYALSIPLSTYGAIGEINSTVSLFTYLHVREDVLQLFGFATEEERELFRILISVNGIGPRLAQGILSGISVTDLRSHIASGNLGALTTVPGIGRKIAERLVVELRDKIGRLETTVAVAPGADGSQAKIRSEALLALTSLGYARAAADKAIRAALQESRDAESTVESLIKAALRHAAK